VSLKLRITAALAYPNNTNLRC